jgi:glycosyltransferase involved in cell wall biosynthesis
MPRRILLLITDLELGGTPTVVRELAMRLGREQDVTVRVACLDGWGPVADQLRDRGIAVTALGACCRFDLGVVFRLIRLIRRERIDTVFSFLIHANAAAALARISCPQVCYLQSIQTTQPNPRWHWMLQRLIHRAAERIVVPSDSVADVAERWAAIPAVKIAIIPNAVEPGDFSLPRRRPFGKHVGFIGRLDPVKRIEDLVIAISLLSEDVSLDIYGEGPRHSDLESLTDRLALKQRVKLHGAIGGPAEALAGMDVLVLPSDAEGFGLVLIEAMAAGVPVIGADAPGIRDVIRHGVNGLLTPPRDPPTLAAAIERIFTDQNLRESLSAAGLASVAERYNWSNVYPKYRRILAPDVNPMQTDETKL